MSVYLVRIVALLFAAFFFYAAYMSPAEAMAFTMGGIFFVLMAYLSFKNSGSVDGPYIYFGFSVVTLFYNFTGVISGIYTWRSHKLIMLANPVGFWLLSSLLFLLSIGFFICAFAKYRKQSSRRAD